MTLPDLGSLLLGLSLLGIVGAIIALLVGEMAGRKSGEGATNAGYLITWVVAAVMTLGIVLLALAFLRTDLTFGYVAENRPNMTGPWTWVYQISGVWAGPQGSIFFWAWLVSLFTAFIAWKQRGVTDRLTNVAIIVSHVVLASFVVLLMTPENTPFGRVLIQGTLALDPASKQPLFDTATQFMSPLLQTWAMVIHPPTLFIGYAGLTIPFAYAVAAMILGDDSKSWVELCDRETVFSWLMLGAGIGLGAIWAYYELAFGGYWAWDPVENASLLPWLTGVGLLHSFTVYRKRDGFKRWAIALATMTFVMVVLGTFITRSGILAEGASVHVFGGNTPALVILLTLIIGALVAGIGGMVLVALVRKGRPGSFAAKEEFDGWISKEVSYELNNVIMLVAALLVTYMTLSSALPSWLPAGGKIIARETYDLLARPLGIAYIFLMVFCPVLSWRRTEPQTFWSRVKMPTIIAGVLSVAFIALWFFQLNPIHTALAAAGKTSLTFLDTGVLAITGLIVAAMGIAISLWLFIDGSRKRAAAKGIGGGRAFLEILTKARTQSGGYLTHLGMSIILLGLVGSTLFVDNAQMNMIKGGNEVLKLGGYEFRLKDSRTYKLPNGDDAHTAYLSTKVNGKDIGITQASMILPYQFTAQSDDVNRGRKEVAIIHEPLRDIFVTFQSVNGDVNGIDVKIFPMISWVWGGFILTLIGSGLASWPKKGQFAGAAVASAPLPKSGSGAKKKKRG